MDTVQFITAVEAQFLMGHVPPSPHVGLDRLSITQYSWEEEQVRRALAVPLDETWALRMLDLERERLANFSVYAALTAEEEAAWQDTPRERYGTLGIHAAGVLRLARLYGRPYVRYDESPALLAHWTLVQTEVHARIAALSGHGDA